MEFDHNFKNTFKMRELNKLVLFKEALDRKYFNTNISNRNATQCTLHMNIKHLAGCLPNHGLPILTINNVAGTTFSLKHACFLLGRFNRQML